MWRRWQAECLDVLDAVLDDPRPRQGLVSAATGSGKSLVQAELAARAARRLKRGGAVVYATSRTALVEQMMTDLSAACRGVGIGRFDGSKKVTVGRVVIPTTYQSLPKCVAALARQRRRVEMLILDEAHSSAGDRIQQHLLDWRDNGEVDKIVGFSATAFRTAPGETLAVFPADGLLYRYTIQEAWDDGVLVPLDLIGRSGGVVEGIDGLIAYLHASGVVGWAPGVVTAKTIEDADALAERLAEAGIPAASIHSGNASKARFVEIEARLCSGDLACITSPVLVAEGYDFQPLKWLCLWAPMGSPVRCVQYVGRVLRTVSPRRYPEALARFGALDKARVLDPHGSFARLGLDHSPALGMGEPVEAEAPRAEATEPREPAEPKPAYLAPRARWVGWAASFLVWAQQQPDVRAHVETAPLPASGSPVGMDQIRTAQACLMAMRDGAADRAIHWQLLAEGLRQVIEWGRGDELAASYAGLDAELVVRAASILREYAMAQRRNGAPASLLHRLPDSLIPIPVEVSL